MVLGLFNGIAAVFTLPVICVHMVVYVIHIYSYEAMKMARTQPVTLCAYVDVP